MLVGQPEREFTTRQLALAARQSLGAVLPYLSVPGVQLVAFHVGVDAGYLLTARSGPYPGIVEIVSFASGDLVGEAFACALWGRAAT